MKKSKFKLAALIVLLCAIFTLFTACSEDSETTANDMAGENETTVIELTLDNYSEYFILQTEILDFTYSITSNTVKFTRVSKVSILKLKDVGFSDLVIELYFRPPYDSNNRAYGYKSCKATLYISYNGEGSVTVTANGSKYGTSYSQSYINEIHYAPNIFNITEISGSVIIS